MGLRFKKMSIILSEIRTSPFEPKENALEKAFHLLKLSSSEIIKSDIVKFSVDARRKDNISLVYSVSVDCNDEEKVLKRANLSNASIRKISPTDIPMMKKSLSHRPVVIGFGPAGMFAALVLARSGAMPIVFERGADVEERTKEVENYWNGGKFSEETNVQFGEGGAGTFSDGKLTCRINDPLCDYIISELEKHGAPHDILFKAKPHIGTDMLRKVVKNIREEIIRLGGEVHFLSKVDDIKIKNNKVCSIRVNGMEFICDNVILAIGHSSRDTFSLLKEKELSLTAKPFSVGFRIEHLQDTINHAQYGDLADKIQLGAADYQLSYKTQGRCAYTFCMCPGGFVVPSESENETIVTNGMSYYERNNVNSNAAVVCSVDAQDFDNNPFLALEFQRSIEKNAYIIGKSKAPASCLGKYLYSKSTTIGKIIPSYKRGICETDVSVLYPDHINSVLKEGLLNFDRKIHGFADENAVLTGPETRTSSPVRILRNPETMESVDAEGLYPCAEGAGYAGGIVSAAVDGMKCALKIIEKENENL